MQSSAARTLGLATGLVLGVVGPAWASVAGAEGELLWRVPLAGVTATNRPALGPDGAVAVQTSEIVVVEADGTERWRRAIPAFSADSICDFDDQGRLYANSIDGVRAFGPDGSDLWVLSASGLAHQHHAGPTVGPDGNIYFCDIQVNGLGFGSVTPGGELRWNVPGFRDVDSDYPRVEVAFSGGDALISSPGLPDNCGGNCLGSGLMSFSLDGNEQWTLQTTTPFQATVRPDGEIFLPIRPSALLLVDGESGSSSQVSFGFRTPVERSPTAVGPDGTGYTVLNYSRIWRTGTDGTTEELGEYGAIMGAPAVSPDGSMIVLGTAETLLPSPNDITAIDAETGAVLWEIALPQENGWQLAATGRPRFAEDGSAVYVGVNAGTHSYLYAIGIGGGGSCPADLASPEGVLDLADVQAFIGGFQTHDAIADLAAPVGVWDLSDVQAFVGSFNAGCP